MCPIIYPVNAGNAVFPTILLNINAFKQGQLGVLLALFNEVLATMRMSTIRSKFLMIRRHHMRFSPAVIDDCKSANRRVLIAFHSLTI